MRVVLPLPPLLLLAALALAGAGACAVRDVRMLAAARAAAAASPRPSPAACATVCAGGGAGSSEGCYSLSLAPRQHFTHTGKCSGGEILVDVAVRTVEGNNCTFDVYTMTPDNYDKYIVGSGFVSLLTPSLANAGPCYEPTAEKQSADVAEAYVVIECTGAATANGSCELVARAIVGCAPTDDTGLSRYTLMIIIIVAGGVALVIVVVVGLIVWRCASSKRSGGVAPLRLSDIDDFIFGADPDLSSPKRAPGTVAPAAGPNAAYAPLMTSAEDPYEGGEDDGDDDDNGAAERPRATPSGQPPGAGYVPAWAQGGGSSRGDGV